MPDTSARQKRAGRDPGALEYTRWGSMDMIREDVQAHAGNGVTRLVIPPASPDVREQREQISALADRYKLGRRRADHS
jgi:hypothetical protein